MGNHKFRHNRYGESLHKNAGNTVETVYMSTADWNPSSTISVLMLTWDKEGGQLSEGAVALATLTLTTAQDTEI
jgi:hypothetical protein